jgi:hypothetical protein
MDILNSDWLIHMLKKSSNTPQMRLLSLFDILDDWTEAPGVNAKVVPNSKSNALQSYLSLEAAKAGAAHPEMLATQLVLMAISACKSKLEAGLEVNNHAGAGDALKHAKNAAEALISAQTKQEFRIAKSSAYAIAASFVAALVVAGSLFILQSHPVKIRQMVQATPAKLPTFTGSPLMANSEETAALIAQIDLMRKGSCQLPEAIQLPDSYKKVYFENIVAGQISTDPADQKLVRELLQKVRCNYTPMLMANSKD